MTAAHRDDKALKTWTVDRFDPSKIARFCDVVMKGGVTSGVVYPLAICHLASKYILKNIGGTSVGAIAAAITAAAEYQRRTTGSGAGYLALSKLPVFLTRKGTLQTLFTADPGAKSYLNVALKFTGSLNPIAKAILALIQFWWQTLLTGIALYWAWYGILVLITWPLHRVLFTQLHWGAGWLMLALLVPTMVIIYLVACNSYLSHNDFGWCHGYHKTDDRKLNAMTDATAVTKQNTPRLIGWLDAFIAQAAGRSPTQPLTFGDLWNAPEPNWYTERRDGDHSIDFRMVTTCLTLGRPFELPFDPQETAGLAPDPATDSDETGAQRPGLYFKKADMHKLFPKHVVRHLVEHGAPHSRFSSYIRFPAAHAVPLIVATRLSMSFPILFCAVRLYATDVHGNMQPVWFSDGGLTSNFPIHFFDSPLPRWPTFAIDLLGGDPTGSKHSGTYKDGAVFLESSQKPGTVNPWNRLGKGDGTLTAFLMTIVDTARTWLDETSITLPGNASRTVGIRLNAEEGGINLAMPTPIIEGLMQRGDDAGRTLLTLFADNADTPAWQDQRWYRYRGAMSALTRWLEGFEIGYAGLPGTAQTNYDALIGNRYPVSLVPTAQAATKSVAGLESTWYATHKCNPEFPTGEPRPFPVFAQRRPL